MNAMQKNFDLECRVGILSFLVTFEEIYEKSGKQVAWRAPPFPFVLSWFSYCLNVKLFKFKL